LSDSIVDFFSSREELSNRVMSLEDELIKLKTITQYIENMSSDNAELNSLWDSAKFSKDNYLIAEKYSLSPNIFQPSLVLKISSKSNVQKNDPVLVETGLVGRIRGIGYSNAEVMLVQDVRSIVPVISEKSQLQGILKGNGLGRYGELQYVKKTASFREGEILYTSGLAEIFPKGAIVGRIISINNPVDSEFLEVKVEFSQSPSNKNFFLIYSDA
jgi:rod shape-determining protein MreC